MTCAPEWTVRTCDWREAIGALPDTAAVVTDPPYGVRNDCDYRRYTGGGESPHMSGGVRQVARKRHPPVAGDGRRPDLSPFLRFKFQAFFGAHYSPTDLGIGSLLVWQKKSDRSLGTFNSDAEVCWFNRGRGVYLWKHLWNGVCRASEHGQFHHPTQKPAAVMAEVIRRLKLPPGTPICDPYCGAGATGVAAVRAGHPFVGCEVVPEYADIARERIGAAAAETSGRDGRHTWHRGTAAHGGRAIMPPCHAPGTRTAPGRTNAARGGWTFPHRPAGPGMHRKRVRAGQSSSIATAATNTGSGCWPSRISR